MSPWHQGSATWLWRGSETTSLIRACSFIVDDLPYQFPCWQYSFLFSEPLGVVWIFSFFFPLLPSFDHAYFVSMNWFLRHLFWYNNVVNKQNSMPCYPVFYVVWFFYISSHLANSLFPFTCIANLRFCVPHLRFVAVVKLTLDMRDMSYLYCFPGYRCRNIFMQNAHLLCWPAIEIWVWY